MMRLIKTLTPLAAALSIYSSPALAQTVPERGIYTQLTVIFDGRFLVMFMACGFCMLEAGLVRAEYNNSTNEKHNYSQLRHVLLCGWLQFNVPVG